MNIEDLTVGQVRELSGLLRTKKAARGRDFIVGETVLVRTVTFFWIGKVTRERARFLHLEPAACIFDTGRFHAALAKGALNEVEPVAKGSARIGIGAIVDAETWHHAVPTEPK